MWPPRRMLLWCSGRTWDFLQMPSTYSCTSWTWKVGVRRSSRTNNHDGARLTWTHVGSAGSWLADTGTGNPNENMPTHRSAPSGRKAEVLFALMTFMTTEELKLWSVCTERCRPTGCSCLSEPLTCCQFLTWEAKTEDAFNAESQFFIFLSKCTVQDQL